MAEQIYAPGPMATPAKYVVPGSSEIVPLAVQALLDGTNASGDFVPTLIFRSQAGHVIARVATSTTVAAGGSAAVTWFPNVGDEAAAAAGTTIRWGVLLFGSTNQVITGSAANGNPTDIDFTGGGLVEDGSGFFFFDPLAPTYLQASPVTQPGFFVVHGNWSHDNSIPSTISVSDIRGRLFYDAPVGGGTAPVSGGTTFGANNGLPQFASALYEWGVTGLAPVDVASSNYGFQLELSNFNAGGAALNVTGAQLAVSFVGAG